jgi:hypothetical protein
MLALSKDRNNSTFLVSFLLLRSLNFALNAFLFSLDKVALIACIVITYHKLIKLTIIVLMYRIELILEFIS